MCRRLNDWMNCSLSIVTAGFLATVCWFAVLPRCMMYCLTKRVVPTGECGMERCFLCRLLGAAVSVRTSVLWSSWGVLACRCHSFTGGNRRSSLNSKRKATNNSCWTLCDTENVYYRAKTSANTLCSTGLPQYGPVVYYIYLLFRRMDANKRLQWYGLLTVRPL